MCGPRNDRQLDSLCEHERAPVGVPESPLGVNQQANRTAVHRLATHGELLKRQLRAGSIRIDVECTELARARADDPARPAVERIRNFVARLRGGLIGLPLHSACEAQQDDRSDGYRRQERLEIAGLRMKRAAHGETQCQRAHAQRVVGCRAPDFKVHDRASRALPTVSLIAALPQDEAIIIFADTESLVCVRFDVVARVLQALPPKFLQLADPMPSLRLMARRLVFNAFGAHALNNNGAYHWTLEPMPLFCKDDRSIHYLERGRGEALLLIHGLGSSVADLPGSGHSPPLRGGPSITEFAAALWALLDHLRESRVNIVGFSLGGAVGLEMSLQRPAAVRRLALINSLANYRLDHWRKWLEACLTMIFVPLLGMRRAARLAAKRLFPMPWQSSLRERASAVVSAVPARSYLESARALIGWTANDRLDRLSSKTLVIAAEKDYTPLGEKRALAARLRAQFVVVRGSRHGTPFDAVNATNAILLALLTDRPLPPAEHRVCDQTEQLNPLSLAGTVAEEHSRQMMRRFDTRQAAT